MQRSPIRLLLIACALAAPATVSFADAAAYSGTSVSYLRGAPESAVLNQRNTTGATLESTITTNTSDNGTESAYARASLRDASLKVLSGGTADRINAGATAVFGDTFGARDASTGLAHAWQAGEQVTFTFAITGEIRQSLSASQMVALDTGFTSLINFGFSAYRPGYFELQAQLAELETQSWTPEVDAEWTRLNAGIDALRIVSSGVWLGRPYSPYFDGSQANYVPLDAETPTLHTLSFAPGGAFEWLASLDVNTRFQPSTTLDERPTFIADFSHSVGASFSGPVGTMTTSGSGFFPDTVAAAAVPEPAKLLLCLAGLAMIVVATRRVRQTAG